jgi:Protein of unknown function (DUF2637)
MDFASRLTRMRWAVRGVLALGVAASVTANVLHAHPHPISQTIAGWPPIALLLAVELISRIPIHRRGLAAVRIIATALIAGIAAWVSYWHMAGVAARYGETGAAAYLLPLSVDGLIVVASVCLVELGGHMAATAPAPAVAPEGVSGRATTAAPGSGDTVAPASASASAVSSRPVPAHTMPAGTPDTGRPPTPATAIRPLSPNASAEAARSPCSGAVLVPDQPPAPYTPTNNDDAKMYAAWRHGMANGQEPSGPDLARVVGRRDDATGVGRRAARRYRDAHASQRTEARGDDSGIQPRRDVSSTPAGRTQPVEHGDEEPGRRHNGHHLTSSGAAR